MCRFLRLFARFGTGASPALKSKWLNFGHLDFKVLTRRFLRLIAPYKACSKIQFAHNSKLSRYRISKPQKYMCRKTHIFSERTNCATPPKGGITHANS